MKMDLYQVTIGFMILFLFILTVAVGGSEGNCLKDRYKGKDLGTSPCLGCHVG